MTRAAAPPAGRERDFWERSRTGWHAAWYGVLGVTAVAVAVLGTSSPAERLVGVAALAGAAAAYAALGARLLGEDDALLGDPGHLARFAAYAAAVTACLVVLSLAIGPGITMPALFVLFPQAWAMAPRRWAVAAVVVAPGALAVADVVHHGWAAGTVTEAAVTAFLQSAAAVVLGLWITGLVRESEERAALLAELTAARAELAAADHARGVLAERERMAGEIHDTLAQGFTSIVALAQAADDAVSTLTGAQRDVARERLALVETTARANLAEARAIVAALAPPDLHGAAGGDRLSGALARLVARVDAEGGARVRLEASGPVPPLSPEAEVVLLRAAQEGLTNAGRHAGASTAVVALAVDVEGVELTVSDDGAGLGPSGTSGPGAGYGLSAMAARAAQVGGSAVLEAGAAGGCVLRVRVPA